MWPVERIIRGRNLWGLPREYPTRHRDNCGKMLVGESVLVFCSDSGVTKQTLNRWKHQALIDAGLVDVIDSTASDDLWVILLAVHSKGLQQRCRLPK